MADAVWPSTVPDDPERDSYNSLSMPSGSSFSPDVGPPSTWRRTTLKGRRIQSSFLWTVDERNDFFDFYYDTLAGGTLPFEWDDPNFAATGRYMFDPESSPVENPRGYKLLYVTIVVIRLRDA